MSYGNKEYQVSAIEQLVKSVSELLDKDASNKVCVFQSPTGSGKTVMVAKFIEEIIGRKLIKPVTLGVPVNWGFFK